MPAMRVRERQRPVGLHRVAAAVGLRHPLARVDDAHRDLEPHERDAVAADRVVGLADADRHRDPQLVDLRAVALVVEAQSRRDTGEERVVVRRPPRRAPRSACPPTGARGRRSARPGGDRPSPARACRTRARRSARSTGRSRRLGDGVAGVPHHVGHVADRGGEATSSRSRTTATSRGRSRPGPDRRCRGAPRSAPRASVRGPRGRARRRTGAGRGRCRRRRRSASGGASSRAPVRPPSSPSMNVNSQSGRSRSNPAIPVLRANSRTVASVLGGAASKRRTCHDMSKSGSTTQRGVASRSGGCTTRCRNPGDSRVSRSSRSGSRSQSGCRRGPGRTRRSTAAAGPSPCTRRTRRCRACAPRRAPATRPPPRSPSTVLRGCSAVNEGSPGGSGHSTLVGRARVPYRGTPKPRCPWPRSRGVQMRTAESPKLDLRGVSPERAAELDGVVDRAAQAADALRELDQEAVDRDRLGDGRRRPRARRRARRAGDGGDRLRRASRTRWSRTTSPPSSSTTTCKDKRIGRRDRRGPRARHRVRRRADRRRARARCRSPTRPRPRCSSRSSAAKTRNAMIFRPSARAARCAARAVEILQERRRGRRAAARRAAGDPRPDARRLPVPLPPPRRRLHLDDRRAEGGRARPTPPASRASASAPGNAPGLPAPQRRRAAWRSSTS